MEGEGEGVGNGRKGRKEGRKRRYGEGGREGGEGERKGKGGCVSLALLNTQLSLTQCQCLGPIMDVLSIDPHK